MKILEQQILEIQETSEASQPSDTGGISPTRSNSTIRVSGATILLRTSLTMFQKICNYLSILSTVLVLGILGGGFYIFKYVTSEQFKNKLMNEGAWKRTKPNA